MTFCFCADLTAIPILVDWNKSVAARLPGLPGMKIGLVETNGRQNYTNWETMWRYHPCYGAKWMETKQGLFQVEERSREAPPYPDSAMTKNDIGERVC